MNRILLICYLGACIRTMSNHPIVPTLNDAYETRLDLNHQDRTHRTNISIETSKNSAYIHRRDLTQDAHVYDYVEPIYEQI